MASSDPPDHSLDSQSKKTEIVSILPVCCVLTTTLVTLRVITRVYIVRAFGPDDWTVVVAQVRCCSWQWRTRNSAPTCRYIGR